MKKILVIEDNIELRENLCEILELADYSVVSAENGKAGIEKAKEENPDLIICDVMMPILDGFGVMKILNKTKDLNLIPLIFLTAKAEKEDLRKGMGLGASDYITKPFDDTELLEAIEIRLQKSERINASFDHTDEGLQRFFSEAKANSEFEKLSEDKELRKYAKKDIIYEEGQKARWLYFVAEGQVKEYQTNDYGKELTTQLYKAGDFFGYYPLINDTLYKNNTVATQDSLLRLIPKEDFSLLLFNDRDFAAQFIKMIANKAEMTEAQLIELAYSSVRKKVANALVAYYDLNPGELIKVTRDNLASKAGTAKETLIRTLSDFKSEGLIVPEGKSIKVTNRDELANIIG
ncbi:response regulator [Saprospiraceae bacterium]|nr:response regulator [Saprospiraceae bacterium]